MRKKFAVLLAAVALTVATAVPAFAETLKSETDWTVTFTAAAKMESNFKTADVDQFVGGMQPGDTAEIAVNLKNDNASATDWYMTNKVISSLEESAKSAKGGAYTYRLAYVDPQGKETVLFSSDTVGGDNAAGSAEGLKEATSATEDHFLLGRLNSGQAAKVTLAVTLDGETQGNTYQDTLADLSMDFAVELVSDNSGDNPGTPGTPKNPTNGNRLPKTGDELDLVPLFVIAGVAGAVVLFAAFMGRRARKEEEEAM